MDTEALEKIKKNFVTETITELEFTVNYLQSTRDKAYRRLDELEKKLESKQDELEKKLESKQKEIDRLIQVEAKLRRTEVELDSMCERFAKGKDLYDGIDEIIELGSELLEGFKAAEPVNKEKIDKMAQILKYLETVRDL